MGIRDKRYVSDKYIENVNHYIYNDLKLTEYLEEAKEEYAKTTQNQYDEEWVKTYVEKGEKFVRLEGKLDHIVVTNLGRVINTHRKRDYKINFTKTTVFCYVLGELISHEKYFKKLGWKFNYSEILDNYNKRDWPYTISRIRCESRR